MVRQTDKQTDIYVIQLNRKHKSNQLSLYILKLLIHSINFGAEL